MNSSRLGEGPRPHGGGPVPCRRTSRAESLCSCLSLHVPAGRHPGSRSTALVGAAPARRHDHPRAADGRQDQHARANHGLPAAAHQPRPDGRRPRPLRAPWPASGLLFHTASFSSLCCWDHDRRERRHGLHASAPAPAPSCTQRRTGPTSWTARMRQVGRRLRLGRRPAVGHGGVPQHGPARPRLHRASPFRSLTGAAWRSSVITTADRHGDGGVCTGSRRMSKDLYIAAPAAPSRCSPRWPSVSWTCSSARPTTCATRPATGSSGREHPARSSGWSIEGELAVTRGGVEVATLGPGD